MRDENDELTPAERELEAALSSLKPTGAQVDPVAAAFEAGGRAARRRVHVWQSATAAPLLLAIGGWLMPLSQPVHRSVAPALVTTTPQSVAPPSPINLVALERAIRDQGVDALPRTPFPASHALHSSDLF
jgi:hypothetical protein